MNDNIARVSPRRPRFLSTRTPILDSPKIYTGAIAMVLIRGRSLLLFSFLISLNLFAAQPLRVWPVDSLVKVFPGDNVGTHAVDPEFWAARGQHASIQFAVRSTQALKK